VLDGFLLVLFFDPENDGNTFFRNAGALPPDIPEGSSLRSHRCENLKSKLKIISKSYFPVWPIS
jgi:hypothetical protein